MLKVVLAAHALMLALSLTACDQGRPAPSVAPAGPGASPSSSVALPTTLFLTAAPADAKNIKDAKPTLKTGDQVTLVGRIGGSSDPFVAQRAIFTLVDSRLKICSENPDDSCATPWDYCCDPREVITANSATIQVVGAEGQPIKTELNGTHGLKPTAFVTVVGTVAKAEGEAFVVNASGLFVAP